MCNAGQWPSQLREGSRVCPRSADQVIFQVRLADTAPVLQPGVRRNSARFVTSVPGFQTHSQRMNTHCWGKARGGGRWEFFFPFVRFKLRGMRLNEGAREMGHGVYLEANCTTPGDKEVSSKLFDTTMKFKC